MDKQETTPTKDNSDLCNIISNFWMEIFLVIYTEENRY